MLKLLGLITMAMTRLFTFGELEGKSHLGHRNREGGIQDNNESMVGDRDVHSGMIHHLVFRIIVPYWEFCP